MIDLPPQVFESFVPISAGIIVSLINKYIINGACCEPAPPEEIDSESDSDDTTKTELTDSSVRRTSAITTASLPVHPIHPVPHHVYYYTH
jgi:hypothetical protein